MIYYIQIQGTPGSQKIKCYASLVKSNPLQRDGRKKENEKTNIYKRRMGRN
jgi:hypothetical protein